MVYDKCSGLSGPAKEACQLDKALVNVASIFAQQVEGRVSTEIDPRTAFDTGAAFVHATSYVRAWCNLTQSSRCQ